MPVDWNTGCFKEQPTNGSTKGTLEYTRVWPTNQQNPITYEARKATKWVSSIEEITWRHRELICYLSEMVRSGNGWPPGSRHNGKVQIDASGRHDAAWRRFKRERCSKIGLMPWLAWVVTMTERRSSLDSTSAGPVSRSSPRQDRIKSAAWRAITKLKTKECGVATHKIWIINLNIVVKER